MNTPYFKALKPLCACAMLPLLFGNCGMPEEKPLLEGKLNVAEPTSLSIVYDYAGDNYVEELTTDSAGTFVFSPQLASDEADLLVFVGQEMYGAFVSKGYHTYMTIDGKNATFDGDNTDRSQFNNVYYQAFSPWDFKPTPDHPFNYDEWNTRLNEGYEMACQALQAVEDEEARARYAKLTDATRKYYTIQTLALDRMMNQTDNEATTDSLIATIDPNADESRLSGLLRYWYNRAEALQKKADGPIEIASYFGRQIAKIDSLLTNEGNKKSLYQEISDFFFMYNPSDSDIAAFTEKIAPQLAKAPRIAEKIQGIVEQRVKQIKNGDSLPSDPTLIATDGTKTTLSEVIKGKVAYIDIWATWCVPCCREIPFMEKVYEKFKDDERIVFVSISQDENRQSWEKKIERDKPQWPNYLFDRKSGVEFLDAMNIHAIPRFVMVGADGRLMEIEAARPSNPDIEQILRTAIEK